MNSSRRPGSRWIVVSAAVVLFTVLLNLTYPLQELSRRLGDLQFRLRPARAASSQVVIVGIDDASLARFGRWPWRRSLLANLLRRVSENRPAAIGLDIVFSEPGPADEDREMADSIRSSQNVVLSARLSGSPQDKLWLEPIPAFAEGAAGIGHVQAITGPDGICRSLPVQEPAVSGPRLAMALEVIRVATHAQLKTTKNGVWIGDAFLKTQGRPGGKAVPGGESFSPSIALIDFRKQIVPGEESPSFLTISAADLLDGKPAPSVKGELVLIGLTAIDASDRVFTPVSDRLPMPGVELHANLLDTIKEGRFLWTAPTIVQLLALVIISLLGTWVALRWPGVRGLFLVCVIAATILAISFILFVRGHIVFDLAPLLCASVLAFPLAQVDTLISLNRRTTRALQQVRQSLSDARPEISAASATRHRAVPEVSWKLDVLSHLQEELASLYNFRQRLLLAMEEGVAVYGEDGRVLFSNPRWRTFCEKHCLDSEASLEQLAEGLGNPEFGKIVVPLVSPRARFETEIQSNDSLWQVRAFGVETGENAALSLMLVATDLTTRLERDRARSEALGFVTHELRTPLSSIQGFAELLMRYPQSVNGTEMASTIFRESQRLVAVIDTYLEVLRLDAGLAPLRREELNLRELAIQVKRIIDPIAGAAESKVIVEIDSDLPRVEGDPNLIAGVLLNLLNNAVKYSPPGSEIKMMVQATTENIVVEVSNPGPPIPASDLPHVFDPFYRGNQERGPARGWGLGLAFVKRIAESHAGRVKVTSDSAATVFRIILPRAAQQRATGA